jgi:hypothetical protein
MRGDHWCYEWSGVGVLGRGRAAWLLMAAGVDGVKVVVQRREVGCRKRKWPPSTKMERGRKGGREMGVTYSDKPGKQQRRLLSLDGDR